MNIFASKNTEIIIISTCVIVLLCCGDENKCFSFDFDALNKTNDKEKM